MTVGSSTSFIRRRARFDLGSGAAAGGGTMNLRGVKCAVPIHAKTAAIKPRNKAKPPSVGSSPRPTTPRSRPAIVATLTKVRPAEKNFIDSLNQVYKSSVTARMMPKELQEAWASLVPELVAQRSQAVCPGTTYEKSWP